MYRPTSLISLLSSVLRLRVLNCSMTHMGGNAVQALARAIRAQKLPFLEELDLGGCLETETENPPTLAVLTGSLISSRTGTTLKRLLLPRNGITGEILQKALNSLWKPPLLPGQLFSLPLLKNMNLAANSIDASGARALGLALSAGFAPSLAVLKLAYNKIGNGAVDLAQALKKCPSPIKCLDLSFENNIGRCYVWSQKLFPSIV